MQQEKLQELIEQHLAQLYEHFEAIQFLGTYNEEGETHFFKLGKGNWYARQGMAQSFIKQDDAVEAAHEISKVIHPEDD